jgi:hypothetical protein
VVDAADASNCEYPIINNTNSRLFIICAKNVLSILLRPKYEGCQTPRLPAKRRGAGGFRAQLPLLLALLESFDEQMEPSPACSQPEFLMIIIVSIIMMETMDV